MTQELLALAEESTKQANGVRARLRLIAAADELLRAGADFVIDQLIAEAASPRIARTLRRAFEYASERAVASRGLIDSHLVLFAIPMVATFAESIPETQWRTALDDDLISCFADGLPGCGTGSDRIVLARGLFDFEQLSSLPLSLVRACATTTGSSLWGALPDDTVGEGAPLRRSTTFLCFAWGRRTRQLARGHANALQDSNRLALALANRLQRQLGPACRVQVGDPRPFHRSLREGLWCWRRPKIDPLSGVMPIQN